MAGTDKQKQSLYFPKEMLGEIMNEAIRLDRSLSWMVQQAWRIARSEVSKLPSIDHVLTTQEPAREIRATPASEPRREVEAPRREKGEPEVSAQVRESLRGKFEKA